MAKCAVSARHANVVGHDAIRHGLCDHAASRLAMASCKTF